jgi:hypothetical protein
VLWAYALPAAPTTASNTPQMRVFIRILLKKMRPRGPRATYVFDVTDLWKFARRSAAPLDSI